MVYLNVLAYSSEFETQWACGLQNIIEAHAAEIVLENFTYNNFQGFDRYQHYEVFLRPCVADLDAQVEKACKANLGVDTLQDFDFAGKSRDALEIFAMLLVASSRKSGANLTGVRQVQEKFKQQCGERINHVPYMIQYYNLNMSE